MRLMRFLLVIFVCFAFVGIADAVSMGVRPAYYEYLYEPGLQIKVGFEYFSDDSSLEHRIFLDGDFADLFSISQDSFIGSGKVEVEGSLPLETPTPGRHDLKVFAEPILDDSSGTIGAAASVGGLILIRVPYPGKYVESKFEIKNSNQGDKTPYYLVIYSRGSEEVVTTSSITLFDSHNASVREYSLGTNKVYPGSSREIYSEIDTSDLFPGDYEALVTISYEGGFDRKESLFTIGKLLVKTTDYTSEVERNKINSFNIEVENFWNDPINNLYAEVKINEKDISFSTPPITIGGLSKANLNGYFDTSGIEEDFVLAKIILHYGSETNEEDAVISIKNGKPEVNYLFAALIIVVVLFVILFIWFLVKLKKIERDHEKKKR